MTTSQHKAQTLTSIGNTRDVLSQARAEGEVARGERHDWRADALERAGELALAGMWQASRAMAEQAR
jgi:hypothetical protein